MATESLPRLDSLKDTDELYQKILSLCRLGRGEIWEDPEGRHRVGVLDAVSPDEVYRLFGSERADLMINDPPYNITVGGKRTGALPEDPLDIYIRFSRNWVKNSLKVMKENSHFYIWLGADQKKGFQPLPDFMLMMRGFPEVKTRSFITLRNQRGYGTRKNWMAVRQELLYYTLGNPPFRVGYTDIPKVLKGYYKTIGGKKMENLERGLSDTIRPGNVWLDIQQVFYRMRENVPGTFAQKPLKAIERILYSADGSALVGDLFAHSGTTLIAAEKQGTRCFTADINPIFAELTIRRLEHYRATGRPGWQWENPFPELGRNLSGIGPEKSPSPASDTSDHQNPWLIPP